MTNCPSQCIVCIAVPTEAPVNITLTAITASRISVSWTEPNKSVLHGNLIRYEIEYRRIMCNDSYPVSVANISWKSINVTNTSLREEIGNLVFWSCYEVRMRAVTVGNGPYSNVIGVRTLEHGELFCHMSHSVVSGVGASKSSWARCGRFTWVGTLMQFCLSMLLRLVCQSLLEYE